MKPTFLSLAIFALLQIQTIPLNAQNWNIAKRYSAPAGANITNSSVALAPDGSTYIVGNFRGTIDFDTVSISRPAGATDDYGFLLKLDAALQPQWARAFPQRTYDVTADAQGNVFVAGSQLASADDSLAFVAKYAPDGALLATFKSSGTADCWAKVVCTDAAGNCYIGGERYSAGQAIFAPFTMANVSSRQCFLVKLSPDLSQVQWATYTGASSNLDNIYDIEVDDNGFVYTSGNYSQNYSFGCFCYNGSFFTEKHHAATGISVWKKIFSNGSGTSTEQLLSLDSSGQSVFVSASFKNTTTFEPGLSLTAAANDDYHIYLAKMDAAGNVQWAKKVALTGDSYPSKMVRQNAELYLNGYFFSPTLMGDTLLTQQGTDVFLVETATSDGTVQSAEGFSGAGAEYGYGLDAQDSVMVVSGNSSSSNFIIGNLTLPGNTSSIYVARKGGFLQLPPVAAFSANTTSGCAPLAVQFTSTSTGSPTTFNWQFAGGTPATSTDPNPSVAYSTPGTYTVTLSVGNAAGANTATQTNLINVNPQPTATFTTSLNGLTATFTNASANASSYFWDFGDGNTSTQQNPAHTYANCDTYTVTLTSTNMCGTATSTASVTVGNGSPSAIFTSNVNGLTAIFSNTSANAVSYLWDFGDGNTSTQQNPAHTYANCDTYTVTLTSTNMCGTATSTASVIIGNGNPTAIFSSNVNGLTAIFSNTSANAVSYLWDFGDGNTSTQQNPAHTYANCDTYTVTLTSTNICGTATSTASVTATGNAPTAMFSTAANDLEASFLNTSTGGTSYLWDFGDGSTSMLQNPPPHVYADSGTYLVTLIVTSPCGADTFEQSVTTMPCQPPVADFVADVLEICVGESVHFTSTSSNAAMLLWTFPGGDPMNSNDPTPTVTYAQPGQYSVVLNALNECGNFQAIAMEYINVLPLPTAGFEASASGLTVVFDNLSEDAISYLWQFGDPASGSNTSTEENPTHIYSAAGTYAVTLASTNDCGSITFSMEVTVMTVGTATPGWLTDFRLFPNPSKGVFSVEMKGEAQPELAFSLFNQMGEIIDRQFFDFQTGSLLHTFDFGDLPPGVYSLRIQAQGEAKQVQVVIQR